MNAKLTLKLEEKTISQAKKYANSHGQSLSKLVETYFKTLTEDKAEQTQAVPATVKSLVGIIKGKTISNIDDYTEYLAGKYR